MGSFLRGAFLVLRFDLALPFPVGGVDGPSVRVVFRDAEPGLRGTGASTRKRKKAGSKYMCDTHSEQINELAKALAAAQGELEPAEKNSTAAVGKEGKLKRKYADLTAMIDAVRKVLPKHGLSIAQIVLPSEGVAHVRTMLMHESGQGKCSRLRAVSRTSRAARFSSASRSMARMMQSSG